MDRNSLRLYHDALNGIQQQKSPQKMQEESVAYQAISTSSMLSSYCSIT